MYNAGRLPGVVSACLWGLPSPEMAPIAWKQRYPAGQFLVEPDQRLKVREPVDRYGHTFALTMTADDLQMNRNYDQSSLASSSR